jgi:hypothetical protein
MRVIRCHDERKRRTKALFDRFYGALSCRRDRASGDSVAACQISRHRFRRKQAGNGEDRGFPLVLRVMFADNRAAMSERAGWVLSSTRTRGSLLDNPSYASFLQDQSVGERQLDSGPLADRPDHSNPRDGCGDDGPRDVRDQATAGGEKTWFTAGDPDSDRHGRGGRTAAGGAPRDRGRDLGSGISMAWGARLASRRDPLFHRFDDHARRFGADAATALANDGRAGGGRRHAAVWYQHGVHFRGDAGLLADALRAVRDPPSPTMKFLRGGAAQKTQNPFSGKFTPFRLQ